MRNILVFILLIVLLIYSFTIEPVDDVIDAFSGATNDTFNLQIDEIAGVSIDYDDDDDDDEPEEEDEDEPEDEDDD